MISIGFLIKNKVKCDHLFTLNL